MRLLAAGVKQQIWSATESLAKAIRAAVLDASARVRLAAFFALQDLVHEPNWFLQHSLLEATFAALRDSSQPVAAAAVRVLGAALSCWIPGHPDAGSPAAQAAALAELGLGLEMAAGGAETDHGRALLDLLPVAARAGPPVLTFFTRHVPPAALLALLDHPDTLLRARAADALCEAANDGYLAVFWGVGEEEQWRLLLAEAERRATAPGNEARAVAARILSTARPPPAARAAYFRLLLAMFRACLPAAPGASYTLPLPSRLSVCLSVCSPKSSPPVALTTSLLGAWQNDALRGPEEVAAFAEPLCELLRRVPLRPGTSQAVLKVFRAALEAAARYEAVPALALSAGLPAVLFARLEEVSSQDASNSSSLLSLCATCLKVLERLLKAVATTPDLQSACADLLSGPLGQRLGAWLEGVLRPSPSSTWLQANGAGEEESTSWEMQDSALEFLQTACMAPPAPLLRAFCRARRLPLAALEVLRRPHLEALFRPTAVTALRAVASEEADWQELVRVGVLEAYESALGELDSMLRRVLLEQLLAHLLQHPHTLPDLSRLFSRPSFADSLRKLLLEDDDWEVRVAAARFLGALWEAPGMLQFFWSLHGERLLDAAEDPHRLVRQAIADVAVRILSVHGGAPRGPEEERFLAALRKRDWAQVRSDASVLSLYGPEEEQFLAPPSVENMPDCPF
jgi:hypothetical protein